MCVGNPQSQRMLAASAVSITDWRRRPVRMSAITVFVAWCQGIPFGTCLRLGRGSVTIESPKDGARLDAR